MGCASSSPSTSNNPLAPEVATTIVVKEKEREKEAQTTQYAKKSVQQEAGDATQQALPDVPDVQRLFRSARDLTLACKAGVKLKESNFSVLYTGHFGLDEEEVAIKIEVGGGL